MLRRILSFLIIIILMFIIPPNSVKALTNEDFNRVVLITVDKLALKDISPEFTPNLFRLIDKGTLGVMNTNTGGLKTSPSCYLTLGAGTRARAFMEGGLAYNKGEEFQGIDPSAHYSGLTGYPVIEGNTFNLALNLIKSWNAMLTYEVKPGILGELIKGAGLSSAVIGNSDSPGEVNRLIQLIAMDSTGQVKGIVDRSLIDYESSSIPPWKTNYNKILNHYKDFYPMTSFLVIELGDLYRLEKYQRFLSNSMYNKYKNGILKEIDTFVGHIVDLMGRNDVLLLLSPSPSLQELNRGNALTPVIIFPSLGGAILSSLTTRQRGIITNIDIPIFILERLNVTPHISMHGGSLFHYPNGVSGLDYLLVQEANIVKTYNFRPFSIQIFIALQIIFLMLYFYSFFRGKPWGSITKILGNIILLIPLVLLIIPPSPFENQYLYMISWLIITGVIGIIFLCFPKRNDTFFIISTLIGIVIGLDLIFPLRLMENSILGYCSIIGGRFYGIGNEYMGIFLGCLLVSFSYFHQFILRTKLIKVITLGAFVAIIYVMSHPLMGANLGGTLTVATAFGVYSIKLLGGKINKRTLAMIAMALLSLLFILLIVDYLRLSDNQSHMGKTVALIKSNGFDTVFQIIARKVQTNIKIFRWSIWSVIFVATTVSFGYLIFSPLGKFKGFFDKHPYIYYGLIGAIWGSCAAFAFNDSGVAPAATAFMYPFYSMLFLSSKN